MIVHSLIRHQDRLVPAEVEVLLLPGLPQIHVLGLPDQVIKESLHRVKSALRSQGFEWPKARQILVNVRPVDRRKSSRGLELAIAAALIWETAQRSAPLFQKGFYVYGELTLSGEVLEPEDLARDFLFEEGDLVLTGQGSEARGFARNRILTLADLDRPVRQEVSGPLYEVRRPHEGLTKKWTEEEAKTLGVVALGEHHWLLAGSSGGGKTTLARALRDYLTEPTAQDLREGKIMDHWRPWVAPHHSLSVTGATGGGVPPRPGEISRADRGILFLDELLEFHPGVQEALREPVEAGTIRLTRGFRTQTYPARLQLIGTTNLCPCGRWAPGQKVDCGMSLRRCRSNLERISGPFFDRFEILTFVRAANPQQRIISGQEILDRVEHSRRWSRERRGELKAREMTTEQILEQVPTPWRIELQEGRLFPSERRRLATLRVARSLADWDQSPDIRSAHLEESLRWCFKNFERLRTGMLVEG
ncbi:MAG: ATP-binding protein [Bdellovibrionaceae bacterium]|nr:ATP-binding protein [Pseudobdellovibrionaceae bacterium]